MEDKEWVLENVEEICANTRDVDEVCMALEHSTIFATEMIQNLTKTILDLQQELSKANDKLKKIEEYIEPFIIDDELDHDCCEEEKHYVAMELLEIIKEEKKESDK